MCGSRPWHQQHRAWSLSFQDGAFSAVSLLGKEKDAISSWGENEFLYLFIYFFCSAEI
jgi:hypothetical protein